MNDIFLVIQLIVVVSLIAVILLQKSSANGFTDSGGDSVFSSQRGKADILTRITTFLAAAFLINSLILSYISANSEKNSSLVDSISTEEVSTEVIKEISDKSENAEKDIKTETIEKEPSVPLAE